LPPPCRAGDISLAPKLKPTSLSIRDQEYDPRGIISLWKFRIHPFLRQELEYDSNIYLDSDGARDDFIYFTSAGLRVDLLPQSHELNFGYKVRIYEYIQSGKLDRFEHVADIRGVLAFSDIRLEVSNVFEKLHDPLNFWYTRAVRREVDTLSASVLGSLGRFRLGVQYSFQWYDFHGVFDGLDHMAHSLGAQVKFEFSPRLEAIIDYSFGWLDYSRVGYDDYQTHTVYAGFTGLLTAKIRGLAKLGYIYQIFQTTTTADPSFRGFTGLLTVSWAPTENHRIDLSYMRQMEISQFRSYQVVDRGELRMETHFGPKVSISLFAMLEFTDPADRPGAPTYQNQWFLRSTLGARIEYRPQDWLALGARFEWQHRFTDITDETYDGIRAGAHLTILF